MNVNLKSLIEKLTPSARNALEAAAGNQSKAARLLRIGRDALRYKLKKHNLEAPDSGRVAAAAG